MKYYLVSIFILAVVSGSCTIDKKHLPDTGHQMFDSLVQLHFPNRQAMFELASLPYMSDMKYLPEDFLHTGVSYKAVYDFDKSNIVDFKESLNGNEVLLKHKDCCIICQHDPLNQYRMDCSKSEVPLSIFYQERVQLGIEENHLGEDFDIYILDSKEGEFIPELNLNDLSCSEFWSHGFSRGVALSEEKGVAIYWLQFW